jgi:hypothetical protein
VYFDPAQLFEQLCDVFEYRYILAPRALRTSRGAARRGATPTLLD